MDHSAAISKMTNKQNQTAAALTIFLLLVIAPFYTQENAGGTGGLGLPYNIPQWIISSWIISYALLLIVRSKTLIMPNGYYFFAAFPVAVMLSSILADIIDPITWLFRQFYILGGFLFLFSLFQFRLKQRSIETILFGLVLAIVLHSTIGLQQIIFPKEQWAWFLPSGDGVPRGMFEQINVQASYLATGMIISFYLISRPFFRSASLLTKTIFILSFGLSTYIIIFSGSRVGLLSIAFGLSLVFISRRKQLLTQKTMLVSLIIVSICASFLAQEGFDHTLDKTIRVTEGEYSTARLSMYSIGLDLARQEPLHGHGIGSFLRVWNLQATTFLEQHPSATLPRYATHPHNELLFWLIEGGMAVLSGILLLMLGIFIALIKCGFQRGVSYAAMALPIALHTQVELPFYTSAVHWFLWLFLIYMALRHNQKTTQIRISESARKLLQFFALFFAITVTYFMVHCARSQSDIFNYLYNKQVKPPYLQIAYDNLYFRPLADKVATRSLFFSSLKNNNKEKVLHYLLWAEDYVKSAPEPEIYSDLAKTATYLKTDKKACELVKEGAQMYPRYEELQEAVARCAVNGVN